MVTGRFISVEGLDGTGKSTSISLFMEKNYKEYRYIRFPSDGVYGSMARSLLNHTHFKSKYPEFMMLCLLDMRERYQEFIAPTLQSGLNVIADRFIHSTFAYVPVFSKKHLGVEVEQSELDIFTKKIFDIPLPDITFLFCCPLDQSLSRMGSRDNNDVAERTTNKEEYQDILSHYERLTTICPNMIHIDTNKSVDEIVSDIHYHLSQ